MSPDSRSDPRAVAIEQLEAFRLSTYAARTFTALSTLRSATAKEVSDVADVPRTRVYDAVNELRERGLVDVQQSSPQRFVAVSAETTRRRLEADTDRRLSLLSAALDELNPTDDSGHHEIHQLDGQSAIVDRLVTLVATADDEITYLAGDDDLSELLVETLAAAADRGVAVRLGGLSADRRRELTDSIPTLGRVPTNGESPSVVSRLLVVDGSNTLVGFRCGNPTGDEHAIWSTGEPNSLGLLLGSIVGLDSVFETE